jgi:hypothetical protein
VFLAVRFRAPLQLKNNFNDGIIKRKNQESADASQELLILGKKFIRHKQTS